MRKATAAYLVVAATALALVAGCKSPADKVANGEVVQAAPVQYAEPPSFDAGLSVEQAYAAIPHHRTVWEESDSTAPADEKAYLRVMFQVLDQAVAVRVASLQNYANSRFDSLDTDGEFDLLLKYVNGMTVPQRLAAYHKDIAIGLAGERQFFHEWRAAGGGFAYAQQIQNHPGVRSASSALKSAYGELMAKYPGEKEANKTAFFDYHCALDFL